MSVAIRLQSLAAQLGQRSGDIFPHDPVSAARLVDELVAIAADARRTERAAILDRMAFADLLGGLDQGVIDLNGRIERARERYAGNGELQAVGS